MSGIFSSLGVSDIPSPPSLSLSPSPSLLPPSPSIPPPLPPRLPRLPPSHNAAVVPGKHESLRNCFTGSIQDDDTSTFSQWFFSRTIPGISYFLPGDPHNHLCRPSSFILPPVTGSTLCLFEATIPLFISYNRIFPVKSQLCHRSLSLCASEAPVQRKCTRHSKNCLRGLSSPRFSAPFHTTWFHGLMGPRCG